MGSFDRRLKEIEAAIARLDAPRRRQALLAAWERYRASLHARLEPFIEAVREGRRPPSIPPESPEERADAAIARPVLMEAGAEVAAEAEGTRGRLVDRLRRLIRARCGDASENRVRR